MIEICQNAYDFLQAWVDDLPASLRDVKINNLCFDSRQVKEGDAFVVMPSVSGLESQYIEAALKNGAALIICQQELEFISEIPVVKIDSLLSVIGEILHTTLGGACDKMNVIGITGTNGKSSISFYLAQILNELKKPCAVMGTLGYGGWQNLSVTGMTTLPQDKLHQVLDQLSQDYNAVAMEVSSHGLQQQRLSGVKFKGAIYSNLSRDHLDYHGTMESYGEQKAKLFNWPDLEFSIINQDDDFSTEIVKDSKCKKIIYYGQSTDADLSFRVEKNHQHGMSVNFVWQGVSKLVDLPLYGDFNAYNVASALACTMQMGFDFSSATQALTAIQAVPGRMQLVEGDKRQPLTLIDYAHTPDALQQAILAVKQHCPGNVHLVVGCGGDRDQGKRALMGKIAVQYADKVFLTSDNPNDHDLNYCKWPL